MFIVKNISAGDIELPDLHIVLSKNDQIDLDMVTSRFHTEQSYSLKGAFARKSLKIIVKDDHRGDYQFKTEQMVQPLVVVSPPQNNTEVIDAVKGLEDKLTKRLEEKINSSIPAAPQIDLTALNQALAALQALANQAGQPVKTQATEEPGGVEDPKVVDIHKRTLNRLAKDAQSSVKHTEETSDNTNVKKNIDELEGLL